jgi:hypothetical protein
MMLLILVIFAVSIREALVKGSGVINSHANRSNIITVKNTDPYTCPPSDPDENDCGTKYTAANAALIEPVATYDGTAVQTAVNAFIASCKATRCLAGCPASASNQNLGTKPASITFTAACDPAPLLTKSLDQTVCVANAEDKVATCYAAYQTVITKLTTSATVLLDPTAAKSAIDAFSVQCTETACSDGCKPVIDNKNVKVGYTGLKTAFTTSCKVEDPGTGTEDNNAFVSIGKNNLLSLLLMGLMGLELWNFF